jgi:hypothetical protein
MKAETKLQSIFSNLIKLINGGEPEIADRDEVVALSRGESINRLSAHHRGEEEAGVRVLEM